MEFSEDTNQKLSSIGTSLDGCYKFMEKLKNDTINNQFKLIIELLAPLIDLGDIERIEEKYE